jgi:hypothetical protein
MLKHLFTWLFPHEQLQVGDFFSANEAYAVGKGVFSDTEMCLQEIIEQSKSNVSLPSSPHPYTIAK